MGAFVKVERIQGGRSPAAVRWASHAGDLTVTVLCSVNMLSVGHLSHFILATTQGGGGQGGSLLTYRHRSLGTGHSCILIYCHLPGVTVGLLVVEWGSEPRLLVSSVVLILCHQVPCCFYGTHSPERRDLCHCKYLTSF